MDEPLFLTLDEVLQLHTYQIEHFGGDPAILDMNLLESAIAQPQMAWHYEQADMATLAAVYLYHIAQNHPFADGNKRTAAHAAIAFLALNNIDVDYPTDEAETLTLAVASGKASKQDAVQFFRKMIEKA